MTQIELPKPLQILAEACALNGINFTVLDEFSGYLARISKNDVHHLIGAGHISVYPLNRAPAASIAHDKAFTHYVLRNAKFSVPLGEHFFLRPPPPNYNRPSGREVPEALVFARKISSEYREPIIVKPNSGSGARHVAYVLTQAQLIAAVEEIEKDDEMFLIQEFVDLPEFRIFVIDGETIFIYCKIRPFIEGDGKHSVRELCAAIAASNPKTFDVNQLMHSSYLAHQLEQRKIDFDSVLANGMQIPIDLVANISAGGQFAGFIQPNGVLRDWVRRISDVTSLRILGIDVFSSSRLANPEDIIVTDVNSSPNLSTLYTIGHRELALEVWKKILIKAFEGPQDRSPKAKVAV